jgi:ketosteroid isomerase-like protein
MSVGTEDIAAELRTAIAGGLWSYFDFMVKYWADEVNIHHLVPMPNDGPKAKDVIVTKERGEFEAVERVVPDYRQVETDVSVLPDGRIRLYELMGGTLPDGGQVRVPTVMVFTVADGRIVDMEVDYDLELSAPFHRLIKEAGLPIPENAG